VCRSFFSITTEITTRTEVYLKHIINIFRWLCNGGIKEKQLKIQMQGPTSLAFTPAYIILTIVLCGSMGNCRRTCSSLVAFRKLWLSV
jgi:hypothetical protein